MEKCGYCEELKPKKNFKRHQKTCKKKQEKQKEEFRCSYEKCNVTFKTKYNLERHMLTHKPKEELPFPCNQCSEKFTTKFNLECHLEHNHPKYFCNACKRNVYSKERHEKEKFKHKIYGIMNRHERKLNEIMYLWLNNLRIESQIKDDYPSVERLFNMKNLTPNKKRSYIKKKILLKDIDLCFQRYENVPLYSAMNSEITDFEPSMKLTKQDTDLFIIKCHKFIQENYDSHKQEQIEFNLPDLETKNNDELEDIETEDNDELEDLEIDDYEEFEFNKEIFIPTEIPENKRRDNTNPINNILTEVEDKIYYATEGNIDLRIKLSKTEFEIIEDIKYLKIFFNKPLEIKYIYLTVEMIQYDMNNFDGEFYYRNKQGNLTGTGDLLSDLNDSFNKYINENQ